MRELLGRDFDKKRLEAARQEAAYERRRRMRADRSAKRWVEQAIQAKLRGRAGRTRKGQTPGATGRATGGSAGARKRRTPPPTGAAAEQPETAGRRRLVRDAATHQPRNIRRSLDAGYRGDQRLEFRRRPVHFGKQAGQAGGFGGEIPRQLVAAKFVGDFPPAAGPDGDPRGEMRMLAMAGHLHPGLARPLLGDRYPRRLRPDPGGGAAGDSGRAPKCRR